MNQVKEMMEFFKVGFHKKNTLLTFARLYASIYQAVMEAVQNAIDEGGTEVEIELSLYKGQRIAVRDNGRGTTRARLCKKIAHLAQQSKIMEGTDYKDPLGQYGVGFVAFIGKVQGRLTFTFTAKDKKGLANEGWEGYYRCDLSQLAQELAHGPLKHGADIDPEIPVFPVPQLNKGSMPKWNAELLAEGFTKINGHVPHIDPVKMATEIQDHFGKKIRENGTTVTINYYDRKGKLHQHIVKPVEFTGKPFQPYTSSAPASGKMGFRVFKLEKPSGIVYVQAGPSSFRFNWNELKGQFHRLGFDPAISEAISLGYMEGTIEVDGCSVNQNRLELVENDALLEFLAGIEMWYHTVGKEHLERFKGVREEELEQKSLNQISNYFNKLRQNHPDLFEDLPFADEPLRTRGKKVALPPKEEDTPKSPQANDPPPLSGGSSTTGSTPKPRPIDGAVVTTNSTPSVRPRSELLFSYERMTADRRRGYYDEDRGVWVINSRHPNYLSLEGDSRKIFQYAVFVVKMLFSMAGFPPETQKNLDPAYNRLCQLFLQDLISPS